MNALVLSLMKTHTSFALSSVVGLCIFALTWILVLARFDFVLTIAEDECDHTVKIPIITIKIINKPNKSHKKKNTGRCDLSKGVTHRSYIVTAVLIIL